MIVLQVLEFPLSSKDLYYNWPNTDVGSYSETLTREVGFGQFVIAGILYLKIR
jgi:hypothetical protein